MTDTNTSLFQALSLVERGHKESENGESRIQQSELSSYWQSRTPFLHQPNLFQERLERDNLTLEQFEILTSEESDELAARLKQIPKWLSELQHTDYSKNASNPLPKVTVSGMRTTELLTAIEPNLVKGYQDFYRDVAQQISERHATDYIDAENFCHCMYQELASRCAMICGRALVLELQIAKLESKLSGDTPEARYQSFIELLKQEETRQQIAHDYPVMSRLVLGSISSWHKNGLLILQRLIDDWDKLTELFNNKKSLGKLVNLETSAGDTHRGGQTVSILAFSHGKKIVYKPRSIAIERAFGDLLNWLNQKGFSAHLKCLKTLDRGSHGWVEFAEHISAEGEPAIQRFYKRQGGLLALLYALEANDFHYENIIANGEHPILVDLETLFHPWVDEMTRGADEKAPASALKRTVLTTGLLPRRIWTQQGANEGIDLSGLSEVRDQVTPTPVLDIEHAGTDAMTYVRKKVKFSEAANMPKVSGRNVRAIDYSQDIIAGFAELYKILIRNKEELLGESGPLRVFKQVETRVIFRETRTYASFLLESLHPDFLGNALERDVFFDQLWVAAQHKPYLSSLIRHEHQALRQMDIPLFNTQADSLDLETDAGTKINGFFKETGLSRVKRKISGLNSDDLNRQLWVIKSALLSADLSNRKATHSPIQLGEISGDGAAGIILNAVKEISHKVEKLAFRNNKGASWFTWKAVGNSHWDLEPMGSTLYDGLAGMVFYFAYYSHVMEDNYYRQLAEEALNTARYLWQQHPEDIQDVGMFSGWGGIIYLLCHLSVIWNKQEYLDEAKEIELSLAARIVSDENQDIVGGCAGAIIALLTLHKLRPNSETLDTAIRCGQKLLDTQHKQKVGTGWILEIAGSQALAGMSHGTAGISLALLKLYQQSGHEPFLHAGQDALKYERALYSEKMQNWPDLRAGERPETSTHNNDHYFMTAWCHGAPGVGLSRLAMTHLIQDPYLDDEIQAAIKTTMRSGFMDNHCLCHGSLGNLDLLLQASKVMQQPELTDRAKDLAHQIVCGQVKTGWLSGYMFNLETPGFMVGFAGMGYQLLRAVYPNKLPSLLSLEAPY